MEHLLYVLWNDEIKPWVMDQLQSAGYILLGLAIVAAVFFGMIWTTVEVEHTLQGLL